MERESNISLGGTIILLALFAQRYVCQRKYTPLYEKGIKQYQNKLMETTIILEVSNNNGGQHLP